jgi:hypothetical protein
MSGASNQVYRPEGETTMSLDSLVVKTRIVNPKPRTREFIPLRYFDMICQNPGMIALSYTVAIPEFEE